MRHATIINTGLQQGVSSYTMFVENRLLSSSSVSILQRLQYLFAPWTCLPKHSFDPTFFSSLSSNQSSMLWNFQPRPRASLLLRVHQQQNQLQRNNPGDGGLHDRWHTYLQRRLRCCSLGKDRLMLAASQPLEHFTAKSVFIQVPRMPWTRL